MTTKLEAEKWLSESEIVQAQARCEQATAGPWKLWDGNSWRRFGSEATGREVVCPTTYSAQDRHPDLIVLPGDADFISASRSELPRALAMGAWALRAREWAHDYLKMNCDEDDCEHGMHQRLRALLAEVPTEPTKEDQHG